MCLVVDGGRRFHLVLAKATLCGLSREWCGDKRVF